MAKFASKKKMKFGCLAFPGAVNGQHTGTTSGASFETLSDQEDDAGHSVVELGDDTLGLGVGNLKQQAIKNELAV